MVLQGLIKNDDFQSAVIPHIKEEYFETAGEKAVLKLISKFVDKYNRRPTVESLLIDLGDLKISEAVHSEAADIIRKIDEPWNVDTEWALEEAEQFCQDRALNCAISLAIDVTERPKEFPDVDLPKLFSDALAVTFDTRVGHDFFEDVEKQFLFYTSPETKIPFDIEELNLITKNGLTRKTLNILMSSRTGGFKTGSMCHMAAAYTKAGLNVLYITLEMSEERIRERIDANMLKVNIDDLPKLEFEFYKKKVQEIKDLTPGRLVIREYPAAVAHAGHFRFLLKELRQKKNFKPDVIFIDYLNLCASQRLKASDAGNSYKWVKSIAEELRGLCQEFDMVGWSATQSGRQGVSKGEDIDVDDVSESYGLAATVDLMLGVITNEELEAKGLLCFKQLKNRYAKKQLLPIFELGINADRMTLFSKKQLSSGVAGAGPFIPPSARRMSPAEMSVGEAAIAVKAAEKNNFEEWSM
jgi:hypothetical protein